VRRQSPLPVRQVIRTERPGGSAFVHLFPPISGAGVRSCGTRACAAEPAPEATDPASPRCLGMSIRGTAVSRVSTSGARGEADIVIDLRTGVRSTWRGGMERDGLTFGIEDLSWTGDGESLAYLGAWCPPDGISYGIYGDFVCSSLGSRHQPPKAEGRDVVREIRLMPGGGTLNSGRVLRPPSRSSGPLPVLVDPDGRELITMVPSPSAAHVFEVVKTSIATGRVVSVLGSVSPVYPLFGGGISRGGQDRRLRTGLEVRQRHERPRAARVGSRRQLPLARAGLPAQLSRRLVPDDLVAGFLQLVPV
jgi:hypothetical protein